MLIRNSHTSITIMLVRLIALLGLLLATAGVASAHAKLKSSVPAADSTVQAAPGTVVAVFDNHDPLQAEGSLLKVTDASGAQVDLGDTTLDKSDADRKTLVVSLKSGLEDGAYTVSWTATSEGDGSTAGGTFNFSIDATTAAAPAASAQLPQTSTGDTLPLSLVLAGAGMMIGTGIALRRRHLS